MKGQKEMMMALVVFIAITVLGVIIWLMISTGLFGGLSNVFSAFFGTKMA